MSDDLTLHPRVRQAIYEGNRDKPLTLNWAPIEPDAYECLKLPAVSNRNAMKARTQIITEALAAAIDSSRIVGTRISTPTGSVITARPTPIARSFRRSPN